MSGKKKIQIGIKIGAQGCAGQSTEFRWTGEAKSNGWNEVLDRASRQPGANVSKNRYYG